MRFNKSRYIKTSIFLVIMLIFFVSTCTLDKGKKIPDVSHIEVDLNIKRFDQDLMSIDTNHIKNDMDSLIVEYPIFMPEVFLPKILPFLQDSTIMKQFLVNPGIRQLYDTCQIVYGDASDIANELQEAFKFQKYHFPERKTPDVIMFFSEYTNGVFTYEEDLLGIGLDFFLGADYPHYNPTFFPNYIQRTMNKEHLTAKAMEAVATEIVGNANGERLIDLMINNGKVLYVLDQLMPHKPDSIKLGYTSAQTTWCDENEQMLWTYLLIDDLLYSTNMRDIRKLVDYSPFGTSQMPEEAPGRSANWMGWQIIKSYMKRNPDQTIHDLIDNKDAQNILDRAKYKPRI